MASTRHSVHIGPITFLVLVVSLCISVLALLSITTAQAQLTVTQRQAMMEQAQYQNEAAAQRLLFDVNEAAHAGGMQAQSICDKLRASQDKCLTKLDAQDGQIVAQFVQPNGKTLDVVLAPGAGNSYVVRSWKATTVQVEEIQPDKVWTGN